MSKLSEDIVATFGAQTSERTKFFNAVDNLAKRINAVLDQAHIIKWFDNEWEGSNSANMIFALDNGGDASIALSITFDPSVNTVSLRNTTFSIEDKSPEGALKDILVWMSEVFDQHASEKDKENLAPYVAQNSNLSREPT